MNIYLIGDDILRQKAEPVDKFDKELEDLVEAMIATMIKGDGIGLAAPQVGVSKQIFIAAPNSSQPIVFINPEITKTSIDLNSYEEGCLSIPNMYADLERPSAITIQAWNVKGRRFVLEADGLLARVIQHELDHLHGVLFTDRLPEGKRTKLLAQYKKKLKA